jgi:hypothetical protein
MSSNIKYIGLDVHKEAIVIAVLNDAGKLVMESIIETKAATLVQFLQGLRGELHVTSDAGVRNLVVRRRAELFYQHLDGLALMQTPHRFRSKRQLWKYSGLGVETRDSAQHRYVDGHLQRSKKPSQVRGLNQDHNHEMKEIFKSTAISASRCAGPFHDFYAGLLAKGMKPEMARLTLARKIAATTLTLWKKGASFDAEYLKPQAA